MKDLKYYYHHFVIFFWELIMAGMGTQGLGWVDQLPGYKLSTRYPKVNFRIQRFIQNGTTVNFLNIQTPKKFVVITLKFEL